MSNIIFQAGNWPVDADGYAIPTPTGPPRYDEPLLPDYNGILTLQQDCISNLPLKSAALNTTYPGDGITPAQGDFYLVDETKREPDGDYTVRFTRTWARIPNAHTKPGGVYYYSFPGLASSTARTQFTQQMPVWAEVHRRFFLVGAGGAYATFADLVAGELVKAQAYYRDNIYDTLTPEDALDDTTTPTEAEWLDFIANGQTIVAEDSKITRLFGNIFAVDTIYIPAQ